MTWMIELVLVRRTREQDSAPVGHLGTSFAAAARDADRPGNESCDDQRAHGRDGSFPSHDRLTPYERRRFRPGAFSREASIGG
jgi:hypothetical protein